MSWADGTASANALGWVQVVCRQKASVAVAGVRVEVREAARSWDSNPSCPSPARSPILQGTVLCSPDREVAQRDACATA